MVAWRTFVCYTKLSLYIHGKDAKMSRTDRRKGTTFSLIQNIYSGEYMGILNMYKKML